MNQVELIHTTPEGEQLIAYMARVSNPNAKPEDSGSKLVRYLIKHGHWSPLEMVSMCVKIKTTRSIAAQILRHRSFSFQEFSQRYSEVTERPGPLHVRSQDHKNRQNSIDNVDPFKQQAFQLKANDLYKRQYSLYQEMLEAGVAKECAREVLPLSAPTTMYMHGNLRSWIHYCQLRCADGTQLEHKVIADQCADLIELNYPDIYEAALCVPS